MSHIFSNVAVVSGNNCCTSHAFDFVENFTHALVHSFGGFDGGCEDSGMPDHIRIGEIDYHHIVFVGFEPFEDHIRHFVSAHFGFEVIGSDSRRRHNLPVFAFEWCFVIIVEKEM